MGGFKYLVKKILNRIDIVIKLLEWCLLIKKIILFYFIYCILILYILIWIYNYYFLKSKLGIENI